MFVNEYIDSELSVVPEPTVAIINQRGIRTIDGSVLEFKAIFKSGDPYVPIPKLGGLCYKWSDQFIQNCLIAMATDSLGHFPPDELLAWRNFVEFQDRHSHSSQTSDAYGSAIGASRQLFGGYSMVVVQDLYDYEEASKSPEGWRKTKITTQRAMQPEFGVLRETAWKSLDKLFMDILNCKPVDDCVEELSYEDIYPCENK